MHRSTDLIPEQLDVVDKMPVTNPLRLLVDLGAVVPDFLVERALEQVLERKLATLQDVITVHGELARRGRRGCGVLRRVLERRGLGSHEPESRAEAVFANICRDYAVPIPQYQYELVVGGRRRRIDFAYPIPKLAVEIDGFEYHSSRAAFQDDRAKSNDLTAAGWTVLRFTWHDLVYRPWWVARSVRDTLEVRRGL